MGRLVALLVAASLTVLVALGCHRDAGRRALNLVVDPAMSAADARGAGATNVGNFGGIHQPYQIEVKRLDDTSTLVTLSCTLTLYDTRDPHTYRIDFWFTRVGDRDLRVEAMAGTYDAKREPIWPVYDLMGTVRLNRGDLRPQGDEPLLLGFELDGTQSGSDAPQKGYFEIPASALR